MHLPRKLLPLPVPALGSINKVHLESRIWTFHVGDALVLARPDLPVLFGLNSTAAFLWPFFEAEDSAGAVIGAFEAQFGVVHDHAARDVLEIYQTFRDFLSAPAASMTAPESLPSHVPSLSVTHLINGVPLRLNLATEELVQEIAPRLANLPTSDTPPSHVITVCNSQNSVLLFRDGEHFATEDLITGARAVLLQELTRLSSPGRDFTAILHAGACGNLNACVILAGPSFSGKSTLCHALMAAGFLCYSDDSACLTPDFRLAGMPFALALREGERFRPSNLKGQSPTVLPSALVFVNYQPNADTDSQPLEPFQAFLELQNSGFWVQHSESAISAFLEWLQATPVYKLTYSRLPEAINHVSALF